MLILILIDVQYSQNAVFSIEKVNSPIFNNVSRLNHSSRMNNTLQTKIEPFSHNLLKDKKDP